MKELILIKGNHPLKLRVSEGIIYSYDYRIEKFVPYTIFQKGIQKAKKMKISKKELEKAEKELLEDEKFLKTHNEKEIINEIKMEMATRGFRLISIKDVC